VTWVCYKKSLDDWQIARRILPQRSEPTAFSLMNTNRLLFAALATSLFATGFPANGADEPAAKQLTFAADMKPIFEATCTSCHGAKKSKAGLKMDTLEGVLKGTKKGNFVVPGKSADSRLVKIVESIAAAAKDPDGKTKALHKKGVKPMTPEQIDQIKKWIDQGAK
jgi:cytochrome c5